MKTVSTTIRLRQILEQERIQNKSVALVPTMGNLHAGHMALVKAAMEQCDSAVVTIFVNPLQFGPNEDLSAYPRTPRRDAALLQEAGCDILFTPDVSEIYPDGVAAHSKISVPGLTENFCGASRPGHFDGVATVVAKLFNLIRPDKAFFGLKDYQQFLVIRKMVADLVIPVTLVGIETVREDSGLALSSRNNYLNDAEKAVASNLYATLRSTANKILNGRRNFRELERQAVQHLAGEAMRPDYFAIRDAENLQIPGEDTANLVILGAVRIGSSRLIDNLRLTGPA